MVFQSRNDIEYAGHQDGHVTDICAGWIHAFPERCETLITPRTKAIVLITPNNPTGAVYSPSTIIAFANLARKHNIALIIDETYRDFILDGPPHPLFSSSPHPCLSTDWRWRSTFIHLFSFSKSYCIPGHRLGLICASPAFIPSINTALDNLQICAPRPPQIALAPLLPSLRPFIRDTALSLVHRHTLFKSHLPPLWRIGSQGGYFAFVQHPFVGVHANDVCRRLAEERGVVCLPAGFFGPKTRNGGIPGEEDRDALLAKPGRSKLGYFSETSISLGTPSSERLFNGM
ncbi:Aspartate aminotransferase [Grifola frondosa]|uniref:Aspartate aminotransferase n=1 Tax=Grifola frondosa TaxID=5627 RepID=A0A1C7M2S1_GRIFR|nr:Aspartate aminotransferase [Grifola frondosa]